ncbi:cobalamin biosynthesis protein, partial [Mycolicibacterium vaccae]|nr:cobalamin biosynthesis protein [Mycolicibacterium vaccae]
MFARGIGLVAGVMADAVFGDPRRGHPVALFGSGAAALERRTYADDRGAGVLPHRRAAGGAGAGAPRWNASR